MLFWGWFFFLQWDETRSKFGLREEPRDGLEAARYWARQRLKRFAAGLTPPNSNGHRAARRVLHIFINKTARRQQIGPERRSAGALGLLPRCCLPWKRSHRAPPGPWLRPCLRSAETDTLPACPGLSPPAGSLGLGLGRGPVRTPETCGERSEGLSAAGAAGAERWRTALPGNPSPLCSTSQGEKREQEEEIQHQYFLLPALK